MLSLKKQRSNDKQKEDVLGLLPAIKEYIQKHFQDIRFFDDSDDYAYEADVEDEYPEEVPLAPVPPSAGGDVQYSLSLDDDGPPSWFVDDFYGRRKKKDRLESVRSYLDRSRVDSFSCKVDELISQRNLRYPTVYRAANLDRRVFSRMMKDIHYQPSKDTAIAVAFALHLNLEQAGDLLSRAGYALSHSDKRDIVIEFFFVNEEYDLMYINLALDELGERPIGYKC